jgi:predicted glycosyltransferase
LFKNVIKSLKEKGHLIYILIKKKDVLEELLIKSGLEYHNILPKGRKDDKISIALGQLYQDLQLFIFCFKNKPDLMVGTSVAISHVGKILGIPAINVNEDDADVVPLYAKLSYPWATHILAPKVCRMGKWANKTIFYDSYHELAYLHPRNFIPDNIIAKKYVSIDKPYFIIRFAKLSAHHDTGIKGLSNQIAQTLIELLKPFGAVYISSERALDEEFEKYRIQINPADMHHVLAFASAFIGDSQTMAAESGVLGVPFIRFNDFVGRISYLDELENKYNLGYGFTTDEEGKMLNTIKELVSHNDLKELFNVKRQKMLSEKIDYAAFLVWFIDNYPNSVNIMKETPEIQFRF